MCRHLDRLAVMYIISQVLVGVYSCCNLALLLHLEIPDYKVVLIAAMALAAIEILFTILGIIAACSDYETLLWITAVFKVIVICGYLVCIAVFIPYDDATRKSKDQPFLILFSMIDFSFPIILEFISGTLLVYMLIEEY